MKRTISTWAYCFTLLVCSHVWESVADCIHMGFVCFLVWESIADCIHMGLLFYSFGLLPCVRVRCGLYSHGLTVLLFWFAPLCESSLWTVFTWAYWFILLVCSLVWESVADCIHMGLLFYSFGLLPYVRVCCGLYPHGLSVHVFVMYLSHAWESAANCTTWAVCVCDVLVSCMRVRCGLYHIACVSVMYLSHVRESAVDCTARAYCFTILICSLVWESIPYGIHMGLLFYSFGLLPYVRVCCGLYPHGLSVHVFVMYLSHAWESAANCTTWAVCVCDVLVSCMRVRCGLYHIACVSVMYLSHVRESAVDCTARAYCFTILICSLVWESIPYGIHMGLLFNSFGLLPCVRVRCKLHPYGDCGVLSPCVRVHCRLYPHLEFFPCVSLL